MIIKEGITVVGSYLLAGAGGEVIFPESVKRIENESGLNGAKSIKFPSKIEYLGTSSLGYNIPIPQGVSEISPIVYSGVNVTSILLPNTVKMGNRAYINWMTPNLVSYRCENDDITSLVSGDNNGNKLKTIYVSSNKLAKIGPDVFTSKRLRNITINGDSLKKVSPKAFKFKKTVPTIKFTIMAKNKSSYKKAEKKIKTAWKKAGYPAKKLKVKYQKSNS